ncbi:hypothetical protein ISR92_02705 [Patescibacteria group bacterium]|nr:hypothetical protein [Patescibacteria group bacterium]
MNNEKGFISTLVLIISFILIVVVVGGAIYLDSTGYWADMDSDSEIANENIDNANPAEEEAQEITFVPYESPDQLYQIQIPDFWTGEERAGAAIFYSYNPADGQPEQRAKIEIGRVANTDMLTTSEWLTAKDIDMTTAQQATFGTIPGVMFLQDNTETNPGDIKSTIYMLVNDQVLVITSESFGGTRDIAVQFFNAILNSWQWVGEITSPDILAAEEAGAEEAVEAEEGEEEMVDGDEEMIGGDEEVIDGTEDEMAEGEDEMPPVDGGEGELPVDEVLE